jgi:phosphoribosylaminoimidazole carboxylase PurK protein
MEPVGRTVGILGGGQLGRMLALAARPLGVNVVVVDPSPVCPASSVASEHIVGSFTDPAVIAQLAKKCDVVTIEIEHVDAAALADVRAAVPVEPSPSTVALVQDKFRQKETLAGAGVAVGPYRAVASPADVAALGAGEFGYPLMLKSRRLAYDGRGNAVVRSPADVAAAWGSLAPKGELYAEKWVPFVRELAVVVVRDRAGATVCYPAMQTVQRDSICHLVLAPAPVPGDVRSAAEDLAKAAVAHLDGAGVFGVELFELADGEGGGLGGGVEVWRAGSRKGRVRSGGPAYVCRGLS